MIGAGLTDLKNPGDTGCRMLVLLFFLISRNREDVILPGPSTSSILLKNCIPLIYFEYKSNLGSCKMKEGMSGRSQTSMDVVRSPHSAIGEVNLVTPQLIHRISLDNLFCLSKLFMPSLYLLTPGTRVSLQSRALYVDVPAVDDAEAVQRVVPLVDIEQATIGEDAQVSTAVLVAFMELDIPVNYISWSGRVLGLLRTPATRSAGTRMEQYRRSLDSGFCLGLARDLIQAKILNQKRILQRIAANRKWDVEAASNWFNHLIQGDSRTGSIDVLRGMEGVSSARYFEELAHFFPEEFPFERRSRRPPLNPVNAVLSYAYTVLGGEIETALWGCGLDPALGVYHTTEDRRASLALDLLEPFRSPVCDALAVDLFSHEMLKQEHFEKRIVEGSESDPGEVQGCFLNLEGRKKFFVQYERRLERQFTYEQTGQRTTLRQLIERQCLDLKRTILEGVPFVPFLMN
jgi:CRISPR-associated protein Cas1